MKVLHPSNTEDSLQLEFEGTFDSQVPLEQELTPFFESLEAHSGEWMPDVVIGRRHRKYSRDAVWKAWDEKREERITSIFLQRTKPPVLSISPWVTLPPLPPEFRFLLELQPFSLFADEERCRHYVELVRLWARRYPVIHASAHSLADDQLSGAPYFGRDERIGRRDGFDKIYEVSWLNIFGPRLVESVGRERMLSTPAHRLEELPNGAVLLMTWPTAADFASPPARLAQARAHVHLRPDLDLSTVLHALTGRSASLAPVQPRFHPDVAPLLSRVVDDVSIDQRQRRIAELNAWRPPEPEEWLPAASLLPVNVPDPERARVHLRSLAERLVVLLHTTTPSVFETSPGSLPEVDYQFWHQEFPRVFERENIDAQAVPAIGAYLGEVLVRHLGGQWVPRQKLEESQVLVGGRAWLPFVRAWRYMRTCQSLLDCSLTQLYRVAERHQS